MHPCNASIAKKALNYAILGRGTIYLPSWQYKTQKYLVQATLACKLAKLSTNISLPHALKSSMVSFGLMDMNIKMWRQSSIAHLTFESLIFSMECKHHAFNTYHAQRQIGTKFRPHTILPCYTQHQCAYHGPYHEQ